MIDLEESELSVVKGEERQFRFGSFLDLQKKRGVCFWVNPISERCLGGLGDFIV